MFNGQPLPCYQPLIDTATGRIAGYEALARLRTEEGELISAGPLFSDPEVDQAAILELEGTIKRMALEHFRDNPNGFLTLNNSSRWITQLDQVEPRATLALLAEAGLAASYVVIEIAEINGDLDTLREAVRAYRAAGMRVAIDDFGAGYAMLDMVIALEPDILKLDIGVFHRAVSGHDGSSEFVKSLALMAEKSGCWIIAEGVETEEHLHFALDCGARYVQGYLFGAATENFLPVEAVQDEFSRLRDHYVQTKLAERTRLVELRHSLAELFVQLRRWLEKGAKPKALPTPDHYPWLLRLFLCDAQGTQISPNYEWSGKRWESDPRYLDHNWSWRPYFYRILAESGDDSRVILSSRYRDATTNQYCMTAGVFIDEGRHLLLVDIDVSRLQEVSGA